MKRTLSGEEKVPRVSSGEGPHTEGETAGDEGR